MNGITPRIFLHQPGTYALLLSVPQTVDATAGALGTLTLVRGYMAYVGSALGNGGLAARLRHHVEPSLNPHWHIDYLWDYVELAGVWLRVGADRFEHQWADWFSNLPNVTIPQEGFGSSDCPSKTHLFQFRGGLSRYNIAAGLSDAFGGHTFYLNAKRLRRQMLIEERHEKRLITPVC